MSAAVSSAVVQDVSWLEGDANALKTATQA
jgi:hypothetical protein